VATVKGETAIKKRIMEAARSLLPNAAETRLVMTVNMRALRHIALLRGAEGADLEIRRLACHMVDAIRPYAPSILKDIDSFMGNYGVDQLQGEYLKV
jgi:thymidylate synthase (FAD)